MASEVAQPADGQYARRLQQRLAAAGLRAVAANSEAEFRGLRVEVDGRPISIVVPYLWFEPPTPSPGVVDAIGLRLAHSDHDLHLSLCPSSPLERVVFDLAEQFRCEALQNPALVGVKSNINTAFEQWSSDSLARRLDETGIGLLIFTLSHMLRYRLLRQATNEAVDDVIETTRGNLARLVGHALRPLAELVDDQAAYAVPALEIARLVAEMAADASEEERVSDDDSISVLMAPVDWDSLDAEWHSADVTESAGTTAHAAADYVVFTTAHDIEVLGTDLYRDGLLRHLRSELNALVSAQAVSPSRLAKSLEPLLLSVGGQLWQSGAENGRLDPSRLTQIVASPLSGDFRQLRVQTPEANATMTFLIDTSGSMKKQRYEKVAVLVDTLARAVELAGATVEVLGFTTNGWSGGRARLDWAAAGSPPNPGRLSATQHIVYSSADESWRRSRLSMAAMLRTDHYREGVDGEALEWAWQRIAARPEQRRYLVVISDGRPTESSTMNANRDGYLLDHLRHVARSIDTNRFNPIALGAIALDGNLDDLYPRSLPLDLDSEITVGTYKILNNLFPHP